MAPTMLTLTPPGSEWMTKGICLGEWELMDDEPGQDVELAKAVCRACPALTDCKTWVLSLPPREDVDGVAAAMTADERRLARRRTRRTAPRGPVPTKPCARCEIDQPLGHFYKRPGRSDGRDSYCRSCCVELAQERRARKAAVS